MNGVSLFNDNGVLKLIVKAPGNLCNINCTYCFEKKKSIDEGIVTDILLDEVIKKTKLPLAVVFHGGEPLLIGKEKFKKLLNIIKKHYPKKVVAVGIQTNGILLDDEWCNLLFNEYNELNIEIAISLDGNRKMNGLRVNYNGTQTFDDVIKSYSLLNKYGKKAGSLSVISKKSLNMYNDYITFIKTIKNLRFVKLNALFNVDDGGRLSKESIMPSEFAEFIIRTAEGYLHEHLYKDIAMEPFLSIIQRLKGKRSRYCNYNENKCFNYITLYPDGTIGPCDCHSINLCNMGNVREVDETIENAVKSKINEKDDDYVNLINNFLDECNDCDIKDFCNAGCLAQRIYFNNNKNLLEDYCGAKHRLYNFFYSLINKGGAKYD